MSLHHPLALSPLLLMTCLSTVALASSASVRYAEAPESHLFIARDSLCIYALPPCARAGTCEAFGAVTRAPRHARGAVFQVRMGYQEGMPAPPPGEWQVWGYFKDAFGNSTTTDVWLTTFHTCISVRIEPGRAPNGAPWTAPGSAPNMVHVAIYVPGEKQKDRIYDAQWYVPGMTGTRFRPPRLWRYYPMVKLSAWVSGYDPTGQLDVRATASGVVTHRGTRKLGLGVCANGIQVIFAPTAFCP